VWTALPSGEVVAFVDVPGHARFVPNMLSGLGPVPAVLFVVSADEGWRQQSAEHLAAIDALGVRYGLLVVTRADLADPSLAMEEARERIARTSLGTVEAVAVSAVTGQGMEHLLEALGRLIARLPHPPSDGPVRLWIDRAFTIRGSGSVVTGTLGHGTIHVDDTLEIAPSRDSTRVRALQTLKAPVATVTAVARTAVNLRGLSRDKVRRGYALVTPGSWLPVSEVDVRVSAPVSGNLVLHIGSAAVAVQVRPLGDDTARLRLGEPLPLWIGDRALLRDPGQHAIVARVDVLDVAPPPLGRAGAAAARAELLRSVSSTPNAAGEVLRRGLVHRSQLVAMGVREVPPEGSDAVVRAGDWYVARATWASWQHDLARLVTEHRRADPLSAGLTLEAARQGLGLADAALTTALVRGTPAVVDAGGKLTLRGFEPSVPEELRDALAELRRRLQAEPFAALEAPQLAGLGLDRKMLAAAVRLGQLVSVGDGVYLLPDAVDEAWRRLTRLPQPFTMSAARQALGTTRRVAVPLLEYLDLQGKTRRVDSMQRVTLADETATEIDQADSSQATPERCT
jgi:selenocysteine-specific elongation factor